MPFERCAATMNFEDEEGNFCTFVCALPEGHDGLHIECGEQEPYTYDHNRSEMVPALDDPCLSYVMTWGEKREEE